MSYLLKITLDSPLISSGGNDWANLVNCDVVYNDLGIPEIPGKRLKGILKDAVRDLLDALELNNVITSDKQKKILKKIFGTPGALFEKDSKIVIGNAFPQEFVPGSKCYINIKNFIEQGVITAHEVLNFFTTIRAQTAIDPKTGSALENSLRYIRCVKKGLTFTTNIKFDDKYINLVAAATKAIRYMGLSRTRGLGEVSCAILDKAGNNISEKILKNSSELKDLLPKENLNKKEDDTKLNTSVYNLSSKSKKCLLRFCIKLAAEAIIPQVHSDPNTVATINYIPGSVIHGIFANIFLKKTQHKQEDAFKHFFLTNQTMFLNAYPTAFDNKNYRCLPLPLSIRSTPNMYFYDLSRPQAPNINTKLKRLGGKFIRFKDMKIQEVKKRLHYHHARALDRHYGRALGQDNEVEQGGTLFTYEVLKEDQSFVGALIGNQHILEYIKQLAPQETHLYIGRSKNSQYGGDACIDWLDDNPIDLKECGPEWNNWEHIIETSNSFDHLIVTCLSPVISTNEYGHPAPIFPTSDLEKSLELPKNSLELEEAWTHTQIVGGFLSHLGLPHQQWPAIAEGSVFKFRLLNNNKATLEKIIDIENSGIGLKRGIGFGRIAINIHNRSEYFPAYGELKPIKYSPSLTSYSIKEFDKDDPLFGLLFSILRERVKTKIESCARKLAQDCDHIPTSSTLNRIFLIIRDSSSCQTARDIISKFRKPAKESMEKCTINNTNLKKIISSFLENPATNLSSLVEDEIEKLQHILNKTAIQQLIKANQEDWQLAKCYMLALIDSLIIKNRHS